MAVSLSGAVRVVLAVALAISVLGVQGAGAAEPGSSGAEAGAGNFGYSLNPVCTFSTESGRGNGEDLASLYVIRAQGNADPGAQLTYSWTTERAYRDVEDLEGREPQPVPPFSDRNLARITVPGGATAVVFDGERHIDQTPNAAQCSGEDLALEGQLLCGDVEPTRAVLIEAVLTERFQAVGEGIQSLSAGQVTYRFDNGEDQVLDILLLLDGGATVNVPPGAETLHVFLLDAEALLIDLDCGTDEGGCEVDCDEEFGCEVDCAGEDACAADCDGEDACSADCDGEDECESDCAGTGGCEVDCDGEGECEVDCSTDNPTTVNPVHTGPGSTAGGDVDGDEGEEEEPDLGTGDEPFIPVVRIAGDERIATAIQVSQSLFGDGQAGAVVLARSDDPADAVTATPFSVAQGAPILLTEPTALDPRVLDEIRRVLPAGGTVFLAGGEAALAVGIQEAIEAAGFAVDRVWGPNRFATATQIADRLYGFNGFQAAYAQSAGTVALVVDGGRFQEATVAGPAATSIGSAVLLSSGGDVAPETQAWLDHNPMIRTIAIGEGASLAMFHSTHVGGADHIRTAVAVAREFFPAPRIMGVATEVAFADPLVGSVDIAHRGGPLLLSHPDRLPTAVATWVEASRSTLAEIRVYGGVAALSDEVVATLLEAANAGY